jgi:hypothetical protein
MITVFMARAGVQAPLHLEGLGQFGGGGLQRLHVLAVAGKLHAHEEQPGGGSLYWAASSMLPPCSSRKPETACTRPSGLGRIE